MSNITYVSLDMLQQDGDGGVLVLPWLAATLAPDGTFINTNGGNSTASGSTQVNYGDTDATIEANVISSITAKYPSDTIDTVQFIAIGDATS